MNKTNHAHVVCVICPKGCNIVVDPSEQIVEGNGCPRGKAYALDEVNDPKRIVTTTVRTNAAFPEMMLPVRSNKPVPKRMLFQIVAETNRICVQLPVHVGQIIIPNVCQSGADMIASRSMEH